MRIWLHPNGITRDYQRLLLALVREMNSDIRTRLFPYLPIWARNNPMRTDGVVEDLAVVMLAIIETMGRSRKAIQSQLDRIFSLTSSFNDRQYKLTVKQMTGVDVFQAEPWLRPMSEEWVAENVRLIKSIPAQHLSDIEGIVLRGVQEGRSATDIKQLIQRRFGVPENRAKLIAQDQISKANSLMTEQRLKQIGVKRYVWRTMGDSRVRDEHAARNGKIFEVGKPPSGGPPGYAIRCRCRAEAVFDD